MLTQSEQEAIPTASPTPLPAGRRTRGIIGLITAVLYGTIALAGMGLAAARHLQADQQPTPFGVQVWLLVVIYLPGVAWATVNWRGRSLSALGLVLVHVSVLLAVALFTALMA